MAKRAAPKKPPKPPKKTEKELPGRRPIYVLSDSTGNLGRHMLTAMLTQFPPDAFRLEMRSFVRSPEQIAAAMEHVKADPGMVFHGMLDASHKRRIAEACQKIGVGVCDLTGTIVNFIAEQSGLTPRQDYELLHHVDETYHHRIRALEFTLEHDDALGLDSIGQADIVLAGVSRTSKTPTSVYLAQLGYRVANVALAMQVEPPRQLLELTQRKVVGLVIEPRTLAEIRARRQQAWRMEPTAYTDPREVAREVNWSRELFLRQKWPILDVTTQAVEETAARIVHALGLTGPKA